MQEVLREAFRIVLGREPSSAEARVLENSLAQFRARFSADPEAAKKFLEVGASKAVTDRPADLAALASVASMILNLDEAITKQ